MGESFYCHLCTKPIPTQRLQETPTKYLEQLKQLIEQELEKREILGIPPQA